MSDENIVAYAVYLRARHESARVRGVGAALVRGVSFSQKMTTRRALPFFGSRAGGKKPLSTRGALFAFGGGCDCADCGSLGLDCLSLGSHVGPPKRHTSASDAGPQCLDASDESPAASAAGPSGPPMELTVPKGAPPAKMANRRLCKELDDFEASAGAPSPGFSAAPLLPSNLFHWRASVQGPPGSP